MGNLTVQNGRYIDQDGFDWGPANKLVGVELQVAAETRRKEVVDGAGSGVSTTNTEICEPSDLIDDGSGIENRVEWDDNRGAGGENGRNMF